MIEEDMLNEWRKMKPFTMKSFKIDCSENSEISYVGCIATVIKFPGAYTVSISDIYNPNLASFVIKEEGNGIQ